MEDVLSIDTSCIPMTKTAVPGISLDFRDNIYHT